MVKEKKEESKSGERDIVFIVGCGVKRPINERLQSRKFD